MTTFVLSRQALCQAINQAARQEDAPSWLTAAAPAASPPAAGPSGARGPLLGDGTRVLYLILSRVVTKLEFPAKGRSDPLARWAVSLTEGLSPLGSVREPDLAAQSLTPAAEAESLITQAGSAIRDSVSRATPLWGFVIGPQYSHLTPIFGPGGDLLGVADRGVWQELPRIMRSLANVSLAVELEVLSDRDECRRLPSALVEIGLRLGDWAGEAVKGCRSLELASLATDRLLHTSPAMAYLKTMEEDKQSRVLLARDMLETPLSGLTHEVKCSLLQCFKALAQPRADIPACFEAIEGVAHPNPVDPSYLTHFRGVLRRAIYRADTGTRGLLSIASGDELLVNSDSLPTADRSRMARIPPIRWASARFRPVAEYAAYLDYELRPTTKVSTILPGAAVALHLLGGETTIPPKAQREVDTLAALRGGAAPNTLARSGRARLAMSLRKIEVLEQKWVDGTPGHTLDNIPMHMFEELLASDPDAFHVVTTEPKEGEVHKPDPRMFYIAERDIKFYLSLVERLAKRITGGQVGNSITRSSRARESDLLHAAGEMGEHEDGSSTLAISFDMSEFSKRFPQSLLREYGSILAEISGDPLLARLDIAFRSALVIHSSRGFSGRIVGVLGGFEGFFNFVWTSLHCAVMETALVLSGAKGMLLAYSDDGLLLARLPGLPSSDEYRSQAQTLAREVRKAYLALGLSFNLAKTFVSTSVAEYLGEVLSKNHLLPTWHKPLLSSGHVARTTALGTLGDEASSLVGQHRAIVSAGSPGPAASALLFLRGRLLLHRYPTVLSHAAAAYILVAPKQLGGLGIPSWWELLEASEVPPSLESLCSLTLLFRFYPELRGWACHQADYGSGDSLECFRGALLGGLPLPAGSRLDGSLHRSRAVSEIYSVTSGGEAPQAPAEIYLRPLRELCSRLQGVSPGMLDALLQATDEARARGDAMSLASSSPAIRLLGRERIKSMQAAATRDTSEAIAQQADGIRTHALASGGNLFALMARAASVARVSMGPLPLRLVASLSRNPPGNVVAIGCSIDVNSALPETPLTGVSDLHHAGPRVALGGRQSHLIRGAVGVRSGERNSGLIMALSQIGHLAQPEVVLEVGRCFGIELSPSALLSGSSIARSRAGSRGRFSVKINGPSHLTSRASAYPTAKFSSLPQSTSLLGRSDLVGAAIATAVMTAPLSGYRSQPVHFAKVVLEATDPRDLWVEQVVFRPGEAPAPVPRVSPFSGQDRAENAAALEAKAMEAEVNLDSLGALTPGEIRAVAVVRARELSRAAAAHLYRTHEAGPEGCLVPPVATTDPAVNREIYRAALTDLVSATKARTESMDEWLSRVQAGLPQWALDELMYGPPTAEAVEDYLRIRALSESLLAAGSVILIRDNGRVVAKSNSPVLRSIRTALTATTSAVYQAAKQGGWSKMTVQARNPGISGGVGTQAVAPDELLDALAIASDSLRLSTHRPGEFNSTTFIIEARKMNLARASHVPVERAADWLPLAGAITIGRNAGPKHAIAAQRGLGPASLARYRASPGALAYSPPLLLQLYRDVFAHLVADKVRVISPDAIEALSGGATMFGSPFGTAGLVGTGRLAGHLPRAPPPMVQDALDASLAACVVRSGGMRPRPHGSVSSAPPALLHSVGFAAAAATSSESIEVSWSYLPGANRDYILLVGQRCHRPRDVAEAVVALSSMANAEYVVLPGEGHGEMWVVGAGVWSGPAPPDRAQAPGPPLEWVDVGRLLPEDPELAIRAMFWRAGTAAPMPVLHRNPSTLPLTTLPGFPGIVVRSRATYVCRNPVLGAAATLCQGDTTKAQSYQGACLFVAACLGTGEEGARDLLSATGRTPLEMERVDSWVAAVRGYFAACPVSVHPSAAGEVGRLIVAWRASRQSRPVRLISFMDSPPSPAEIEGLANFSSAPGARVAEMMVLRGLPATPLGVLKLALVGVSNLAGGPDLVEPSSMDSDGGTSSDEDMWESEDEKSE